MNILGELFQLNIAISLFIITIIGILFYLSYLQYKNKYAHKLEIIKIEEEITGKG